MSGYYVTGVTVVDAYSIDLEFSGDLALSGDTLSAWAYVIPGLNVLSVTPGPSASKVRIYTSQQTAGASYTVTPSTTIYGANGELIAVTSGVFTGVGATEPYVVASQVQARSDCRGRTINLYWTNPVGTKFVMIVRRKGAWAFDLTDDCDRIFRGSYPDGGAPETFCDTGVVDPIRFLSGAHGAGDTTLDIDQSVPVDIWAGKTLLIDRTLGPEYRETVVASGNTEDVITTSALTQDYNTTYPVRVAEYTPLDEQEFYYYTVYVSDVASPAYEALRSTDASRAVGLSIAVMDSKNDFFWKNTPDIVYEKDLDTTAGNGFTDRLYDVFGCWLNLTRGWAKALLTIGDSSKSPYHVLEAKVVSLGSTIEGAGYDYDIPRRQAMMLANVYKRKGTCTGIVRAVRMLTKWDATCVEFGQESGCAHGPRSIQTWDGESAAESGMFNLNQMTYDFEAGTITDPTKNWAIDMWAGGFIVGPFGDIACIQSNTATTLVLKPVTNEYSLAVNVSVGDTGVILDRTDGIFPGETLQLSDTNGTTGYVTVISVTPGSNLLTVVRSESAYASSTTRVTHRKTGIRWSLQNFTGDIELVSEEVQGTPPHTWTVYTYRMRVYGATDTYPWADTAFKGYYVIVSDSAGKELYATVSKYEDNYVYFESEETLTAGTPRGTVMAKLLLGSTVEDPFVAPVYDLYNRNHSFTYDAKFGQGSHGTLLDPLYRLWQGPGQGLYGSWGPSDVGVYIKNSVYEYAGKVTTANYNVLTLDDTQPAPTTNALVGFYLNPNQNQSALYKIVSNTTTTITVDGNIGAVARTGQVYYVLSARNAVRLQQLSKRLGPPSKEFSNSDVTARILFL